MKKETNFIFSIFTFFLLVFAISANAAPLEIGALDFPPYFILENNTNVKGGIHIDMLKMMFEKAGIEYTLQGYPPKRLYTNAGNGTTQVFMGTRGVPEYEGKTIVSPKPLAEISLEIYTLGDEASLPTSVDNLKGKYLIIIFGYGYGGLLKFLEDPQNNIKTESPKSHEAAFKMLQIGRAPFVLDYSDPATEAISKLNIQGIKKTTLKTIGLYLHISNKVKDGQEIMNRLMKAYDELKAEGKIK